jgi:asparagine synthase (glutamine-hydrolysing)
MPGLVGIVSDLDGESTKTQLINMIHAMQQKDWYKSDQYIGAGVGLGRVSTALLNPEPQPIWNEDKTVCIVMEGELFDSKSLKQELIVKGYRFELDNDAELILHLFEEYGKDFAIRLNGVFVAAIWNQREQELLLVNDRLGLRPLYYASYNGRFAFASGVRALLTDPSFPRIVDAVAIAQMLSFEYILGNRTLLRNAQLLPPASLLILHGGNFTISPYWEACFSNPYHLRGREEYLEGLIHYMRQAVARQMPGDIPAGLNLSGGLDSRMLLGLLRADQPILPLRTYTFGVPGCDDVRIARELAHLMHVPHSHFELKPAYLLNLVEEGVRLTDGMESAVHMHALANLETQAGQVRILYTGFLADYLVSPEIKREWLANFDSESIKNFIFNDINILFRKISNEDLYTKDFQRQFGLEYVEDFQNRVAESRAANLADWRDQFDLYQRQRRFTKQGDELLRSRVICRTPFSDNDLVEFSLSMPPGLRLERLIFIEALVRLFPNLAKVPWDKTGFPLVPSARELYLRFDQQARWQLRKYGFKGIPDRHRRSYVDYDSWMRTELRGWVEGILLSKRTSERGYFNPSFIRNLVSLHMDGQNFSAELGILITIELWHRQFLD